MDTHQPSQAKTSRLNSLVDFETPTAVKKSARKSNPTIRSSQESNIPPDEMAKLQDQLAYMFLSQNQETVKKMLSSVDGSSLISRRLFDKKEKVGDSTDNFFGHLINGNEKERLANYQTEAEILGYSFESKKLAIIVFLDGFKENCLESADRPAFEREEIIRIWKKRIEEAMTNFFTKNGELITSYIGENKFLVLKSVRDHEENSLKERLRRSHKAIFSPLKTNQIKGITVGFGHAYSEIEGLVESCHEANIALNMGIKLGDRNKSYYLDDFGIMYTLAEGNLAKKALLADQMVSKIGDNNLLKTLVSFLRNNLNITDTALELAIHRNTAIYRLEQITEKLGLDPRKFEEAVKIKLALYIKDLAA
jgi:sugar diacid utilization regulator